MVGGASSEVIFMRDMVYQGTTWGPSLWNTFFACASSVIRSAGFWEVIYADDLNAYREYFSNVSNEVILRDLASVQQELHK